ncbi:MAG: TatD family hydrolase [Cytophagales bacterium]|nr:TatD family hydrolase [Cytophagales bacterium]
MIDTHAHLYDDIFTLDIETNINQIIEAGINEVWLPNCDVETLESLLKLSTSYPNICKPMIGLHPTYVKTDYLDQLAILKSYLDKSKFLAIGEIGLDYYWDVTYRKEQIDAFETQCQWALDKNIWVDIHCRKAYADIISILSNKEFSQLTGIIHCFSGDASEATRLTQLGYSLGIGGVITYKNTNLFESIKHIDLKYLVLETDSPYLTPVPFRGKTNHPQYIKLIAQKLADLFEVQVGEIIKITTGNALKFKAFSNFQ